jgi:hypothetical protein
MSDDEDSSPRVANPTTDQPSTPSLVHSVGSSAGLGGQPDFEAMMAYWERKDRMQQERFQQLEQRLEALVDQQQRRVTELEARRSAGTGVGAVDLTRSPVSTYTRMRSVQRSLPFTTLKADNAEQEIDRKEAPSSTTTATVTVGVDGMKLKDILSLVPKYVEPFYADSTKDKGRTVVQFLDSINMVMNTFFTDPNSPHQLTVVRLQLREGALRWLQGKETALREAAVKEGRDLTKRPLSWQDEVEEEFVRAHLGTDLPELWLAQLRALQLGKGKTKTPIELDSQFDTLARHVYPTHTTEELEGSMLLAETYGECVASGQPQLFDRIMEIHTPSTLREWKIALTKQWNAAERVKARKASQSTSSLGHRGSSSGGWRGGRGGRGWNHQSNEGKVSAPTLNAIGFGESMGEEGEGQRAEGEMSPQLNAVPRTNNQRGGRGGRGGHSHGGGNGGPRVSSGMSSEQQKLYNEKRCFRCKQVGHTQWACPTPPEPRGEQSNE